MQFARVAHSTGFIYCYPILEANRRSEYAPTIPSPGISSNARPPSHSLMLGHSMTSELNTFFPFDPYKLPKSSSYIQGVYREWSSVAIDDDEEEEEDDENVLDLQDNVVEPVGISVNGTRRANGEADDDDADGLGASFGGMSISPIRPDPLLYAPPTQ
ncbi:hypothetical protein A0H81_09609 [Grifola frondosa]|uniref:Uncharacterized protein n=1 Tax=Grifola frondosa TaxID=5627 RepID=A0A1C7M5F9_GRIFR|nr:hypothetical protein A0H81_09609 [Grifola frondosa]